MNCLQGYIQRVQEDLGCSSESQVEILTLLLTFIVFLCVRQIRPREKACRHFAPVKCCADCFPPFLLQIGPCKMELRVASILLLMVALVAAHGDRYVMKKMVKAAPQYQPYSVKSHGKKQPVQTV